jgi:hypothetical protein
MGGVQKETAEQNEAVFIRARREHLKAFKGIANSEYVAEQPVLTEKVTVGRHECHERARNESYDAR